MIKLNLKIKIFQLFENRGHLGSFIIIRRSSSRPSSNFNINKNIYKILGIHMGIQITFPPSIFIPNKNVSSNSSIMEQNIFFLSFLVYSFLLNVEESLSVQITLATTRDTYAIETLEHHFNFQILEVQQECSTHGSQNEKAQLLFIFHLEGSF